MLFKSHFGRCAGRALLGSEDASEDGNRQIVHPQRHRVEY